MMMMYRDKIQMLVETISPVAWMCSRARGAPSSQLWERFVAPVLGRQVQLPGSGLGVTLFTF